MIEVQGPCRMVAVGWASMELDPLEEEEEEAAAVQTGETCKMSIVEECWWIKWVSNIPNTDSWRD